MKTRSGQIILPTIGGGLTSRWKNIGNLTAVQTEPAVGARDWSTIMALADANTIKWDIPELAKNTELRFETNANANVHQIHIMVAADQYMDDETTEEQFTLGSHLTLTGGNQVGTASNVFVDTIAETTTGVLDGTIYNSGADRIATFGVDLRGYRKAVIIAVVFQASTTLYAHARC